MLEDLLAAQRSLQQERLGEPWVDFGRDLYLIPRREEMTGAVKVLETLARELAVRNDVGRIVPSSQPGRAPIDIDDLAFGAVVQRDPIAETEWALYAHGYSGKEVAQSLLHGESDKRGNRPGRDVHTGDRIAFETEKDEQPEKEANAVKQNPLKAGQRRCRPTASSRQYPQLDNTSDTPSDRQIDADTGNEQNLLVQSRDAGFLQQLAHQTADHEDGERSKDQFGASG
jgi:hypothetical protein